MAVLAGYGPRCAARRREELQSGPQGAAPVELDAWLSAVALVTAQIGSVDVRLVDLVEDADPAAVIRCLTWMASRLLVIRSEPPAGALQDLAAFAVNGRGSGEA